MRLFLLLVLTFIIIPSAAGAQEFYDPDKDKATTLDERLGLSDPSYRDLEDTESKQALAGKYFKRCMKNTLGDISPQAQESLCACVTSGLIATMSLEEMHDLFAASDNHLEKSKQIYHDIYAPCMEIPTELITSQECLYNPLINQKVKAKEKVCACMGEMTRKSFHQDNRAIINNVLSQSPDTKSLLTSFLTSEYYSDISSSWMVQCMRIFEYGMKRPQKR